MQVVAEEKARSELSRFRGKPLFEKLMEEYEQQKLVEVRRVGDGRQTRMTLHGGGEGLCMERQKALHGFDSAKGESAWVGLS